VSDVDTNPFPLRVQSILSLDEGEPERRGRGKEVVEESEVSVAVKSKMRSSIAVVILFFTSRN
jgi:hypothetical protein